MNALFMLVCQDFDFCKDFVSIKKEGGGQQFRSLEVQRKLIALKKNTIKIENIAKLSYSAQKVLLRATSHTASFCFDLQSCVNQDCIR